MIISTEVKKAFHKIKHPFMIKKKKRKKKYILEARSPQSQGALVQGHAPSARGLAPPSSGVQQGHAPSTDPSWPLKKKKTRNKIII